MKRAYITILSSDDFKPGVIALYRGIRKYSQEDFGVLVSEEVSDPVKAELGRLGALVIDERNILNTTDELNDSQKNDRWAKTLFKLTVFKYHGYDKVVYLDSDLLIRAGIDELFDRASFSAVADKDFFPRYSRGGLNAGVMVIEPSEAIYEDLIKEISKVAAKGAPFGDQDVINSYFSDWESEPELHLDVLYNTCFYDAERASNPKVVHFILGDKPWMCGRLKNILKTVKWGLTGKRKQIKYLREYLGLLRG
ncbi:MAG: hypothetical protein J5717_01545 [Lachnospiraceae bacterium]|nr:hypothetical protein [Lachnospiraceae bacterium]